MMYKRGALPAAAVKGAIPMKMQELLKQAGQLVEMTACDVGEYAAFKAKGMKVTVQQYRLGDWGTMGVLESKGLLSRSLLVINSMDRDIPVLVCQYASALGKNMLQIDLLDVVKNKSAVYAFSALEDLADSMGKDAGGAEDWYDDMKLPGSCKKTGSKKNLDALCEQVVGAYLKAADGVHPCNHVGYRADKLRKFLDGVFEKGGFTYDAFQVCLKKEADELYTRVLFGIEDVTE